jgi:hypothetical protein
MYRCLSYYVWAVHGQPVRVTTRVSNNRGTHTDISDVTTISLIPPHGRTVASGPESPHYRGFKITITPQSVGLLWMSDQPNAETSTWQKTNTYKGQTLMLPAGFEPAIPASERPQTHAIARVATGTGRFRDRDREFCRNTVKNDPIRKNSRNV